MKQRVRLTESDLRNIVREAINELDWKTTYNAKEKIAKQQDNIIDRYENVNKIPKSEMNKLRKLNDRYTKFDDYTNNTFRQKHGFEMKDGYYPQPAENYNDQYVFIEPDRIIGNPKNPHFKVEMDNKIEDERYWNARKEAEDFFDNKYEYQKGKGWVKKDIDETISRVIREYIR